MNSNQEKAIEFTRIMLEIIDSNWVDKETFKKLEEILDVHPGEMQVDFYNRILASFKKMHPNLLSSEKREAIIKVLQECQEIAVAKEEELLSEESNEDQE